jgi:hypothetical protein
MSLGPCPVTKLRESHCATRWSQTTAQWMDGRLSAIRCLSILQPTFRTALSGDILEPLSAVLHSVWRSVWRYYVQPTTRSALPGDITTDHLLYRLSALPCLAIYYTRLSDVLYSVWRFYSRLSNLPTICSDLYGDITNDYLLCSTLSCDTTTVYLRCSTMSGVTTTDYPLCSTCRYYNRLSAVLEFCPFSFAFGSISSSYYGLGIESIGIV